MRLLIFFLTFLACHFANANSDEWTLKRDKNGIQIYTKPVEGSNINAVKGVTIIRAPMNRLIHLLLEPEYRTDWDKLCNESFLFRSLNDNESLVYVHHSMPWPVSDRDMLTRVTWYEDRSTSTFYIKSTGTTGLYPVKKEIVRVTELTHDWILEPKPDGSIHVTTQIHLDPAGPLPAWLINTLSIESPYDALRKLKTLAASDGVETPKYWIFNGEKRDAPSNDK